MLYTTPPCIRCHQASTVDVDPARLVLWQLGGKLIQTVWPDWTPDQRELLMTGTHPACWDAMFPPDSGDDEDGEEE